jgi:hypothetical protein
VGVAVFAWAVFAGERKSEISQKQRGEVVQNGDAMWNY